MKRVHDTTIGARLTLACLAILALLTVACGSAKSSASPTTGASTPVSTPRASTSATATLTSSPTAAMSPSPSASASALPATCTTVATGLLNPRGITIAADGTIYVAEAGVGGTEPDFANAPAASPGASGSPSVSASPTTSGSPEPVATHGETGQVTMITPDGQQSVFVSGLTSYNFLGQFIGPSGVVAGADGTVYVANGGPGPGLAQFVPAGTAGSVLSVDSTGTVTPLANIAQYERDNNPDPNSVDSNLGGMAMGADGLLYVVDSGGNTLYSIDLTTGELQLVTVFPGLPSPNGAANPERGGAAEVDPVPTSIVAGSDGNLYVGLLAGAMLWGTPGAAKVVEVSSDGSVTDAVTGLNMVTGVALNGDAIWASELSTNFALQPPAPGDLAMAQIGGTPTPVIAGLPLPYGLALAPDGQSIYIVINSTGSTDAATANGEVIQCAIPQTTPSGAPASNPPASPPTSASPSASLPASMSPEPSASTSTSPGASPSSTP